MTAWIDGQLEQASPDMLRSMLQAFAQALLGAQADAECGAQHGQRSPDWVNSRNGYRQRPWDTRAGTIDLAIPRLRSGSAIPEWLPSVTPCASNGDCLPVLLEGPVEASVAEGAFGAGAAQR
ncbi:MAG: transposase, partial [Alphaproteobacteria bacterium]|nr:transposase [Alphaproteobacteria bacterium]